MVPRNRFRVPSQTAKPCGSMIGAIAFCTLEMMDFGMWEMTRNKMRILIARPAT